MSDPSCHNPENGCTFAAAGKPGDCSGQAGILTYSEIQSRNTSFSVESYYDPVSTVKYSTYSYDQWISYDDAESFADKKKYLNSRCLGGLMIWSIDQDTQNYDALTALLGEEAVQDSLFQSRDLSEGQKQKRSSQFAAYTGQNCFVTELCTDGSDRESGPKQLCPAGSVSVETAHAPLQSNSVDHGIIGQCSEGWYRHICCPASEVPKNCEWNGAPVRSATGCNGECGNNQFELNTDPFTDALGHGQCYQGKRSLCCDSAELLNDCFWTSCQGPLSESQVPGDLESEGCPADTVITALRYDTDDGGWCSSVRSKGNLHSRFKRALCCPKKESFTHCSWDNNNQGDIPTGEMFSYHPCTPGKCYSTQTKISQARQPAPVPPRLLAHTQNNGRLTIADLCTTQPILPEYNDEFSLCCDPPSEYTERWPVPPHYLWENAFEDEEDDVAWTFADNYGNNNADKTDDDINEDPGDDPYGFIMLDGGPESLSNSFGDDFTVAKRFAPPTNKRRSLLTSNQTVLDATFEHAEETIYVYCNHEPGSPQCEHIFMGGAPDTIISLPPHVGEGPYARIVHMVKADDTYNLPDRHLRSRALDGNTNAVYELKFDYNFHMIRDDKGPVNMRIDYTNLLPYWDEVTNSEAKRKRQSEGEPLSNDEWKARIKRASKLHSAKKRSLTTRSTTTMMGELDESHLAKRWFGSFLNWLKKLNTVESQDKGFLEMIAQKSFLLYDASVGCLGRGYYASMQMYLDAKIEMDATYAYYFTGTIVPPKIDQTFAYLGVEPSAYLGLRIQGNAELYYESERKKLIDTLTYPGLSIKGIAVVGPSLDIYGQIRGRLTLSGQIRAGATASFGKAELYFPQNSDADNSDILEGIPSSNSKPPKSIELAPEFHASAQAVAALDIIVSPEAKLGLTIAPKILGNDIVTLVDAQLIGFVNGTLEFSANVTATAGSGEESTFTYGYGAFLFYNLGYGGYANLFSDTWNWKYSSIYAYPYPGKKYTIYENSNLQSDDTLNSRRSIDGAVEERKWFETPSRIIGRALLNDESLAVLREAATPEKIRAAQVAGEQFANETSAVRSRDLFFGKRDPGDGSAGSSAVDVQNPAVNTGSQKFTCPPRGNRDVILPDFRYNCLVFSASQLTGNGGSVDVPGICDGITQFFSRRGLSSNGLTLTYEPNDRDARDRVVCVKGIGSDTFCSQTNKDLRNTVGLQAKRGNGQDLTSCDEFPFGSAEEGGNFFRFDANQRNNPTATCVPVWQQSLQGNCNSRLTLHVCGAFLPFDLIHHAELFNKLNTNIAFFDQEQGQNVDAVWKAWTLGAWTTRRHEGDDDVAAFERLARYPEPIPQAPGVYPNEWSDSDKTLGKNFKRNYTFGLAYTTAVADTEWGSQAFVGYDFRDAKNGARGSDATAVACAVNTFGQPDVYRWIADKGFNGYCYRGPGNPTQGMFAVLTLSTAQELTIDIVQAGAHHPHSQSAGSTSSEVPTRTTC
nr:chitinase-3-like protein 1 [Quercus suber]